MADPAVLAAGAAAGAGAAAAVAAADRLCRVAGEEEVQEVRSQQCSFDDEQKMLMFMTFMIMLCMQQ